MGFESRRRPSFYRVRITDVDLPTDSFETIGGPSWAEQNFCLTPDLTTIITAPYTGAWTRYDYDSAGGTVTAVASNYTGWARHWAPVSNLSYGADATNERAFIARGSAAGSSVIEVWNLEDDSLEESIPLTGYAYGLFHDAEGDLYFIDTGDRLVHRWDGDRVTSFYEDPDISYAWIDERSGMFYSVCTDVIRMASLEALNPEDNTYEDLVTLPFVEFPVAASDRYPGPYYFMTGDSEGNLYTGRRDWGDRVYRLYLRDAAAE